MIEIVAVPVLKKKSSVTIKVNNCVSALNIKYVACEMWKLLVKKKGINEEIPSQAELHDAMGYCGIYKLKGIYMNFFCDEEHQKNMTYDPYWLDKEMGKIGTFQEMIQCIDNKCMKMLPSL